MVGRWCGGVGASWASVGGVVGEVSSAAVGADGSVGSFANAVFTGVGAVFGRSLEGVRVSSICSLCPAAGVDTNSGSV